MKYVITRIRCWWHSVCYYHHCKKDYDLFGFSYCQSCRRQIPKRIDKASLLIDELEDEN